MADVDFNDVLENIFLGEEHQRQKSYEEGLAAGKETGNVEGYHLGYHRGAELGRELGYYLGVVTSHLNNSEGNYSDKVIKQLEKVKELIDKFPKTNSEDHNIIELADEIRTNYKKVCALLKISSTNPYITDVSF